MLQCGPEGDLKKPQRDKDNQRGASRRDFLAGAGLTGVAVAAGAWPAVIPSIAGVSSGALFPVSALAADKRSFTASRFGVELDGSAAGFVSSMSGGVAFADVVNEKVGADGIVHKHLGAVRYEDITLECGTGMSSQFYQWIKSSLDGKIDRRDGAIVAVDSSNTEQSRTNFFHGLISEIGFPALDAASKDAAKMTLKVSPEFTRSAAPGGQLKGVTTGASRKRWAPANFRLEIGSLDCTRVNKIEALTLKQTGADNAVGEVRKAEPGSLVVPNLVITMAESHAQDFYNWHEDFVIRGNNGDGQEKSGSLEFLSSDLATLFTLKFSNLGIFKIGSESNVAGSESIRRVRAEMYCEQISFDHSASASS
jgi:phage tail-like protein